MCENENCKARLFRSILDEHMKSHCMHRVLNCIHCNDEYIYANSEVNFIFQAKKSIAKRKK